ncbi:MAG TPA: M1 family aminopeptidase [Chitinophagaceae bacterium]|nr:M1 family aminopeptidase [Chitinophagaceae bacterium]
MKRAVSLMIILFISLSLIAQHDGRQADTTWKTIYRETAPRINDLVHTKLDARLDFSKSHLNGKVWITLKPHFYATDSLTLDAKGMDIHKVNIVKGSSQLPLKYEYDGMIMNIKLDKKYKGGEQYTVYIEYTAKPDEFEGKGSAAITDAKGLYFINPRGEEKDKPTQLWTQGETEATSVWVPTIDKPNQKTTQEIAMTVPAKFVTLSNGILVSQKKNTDGTRTDTWKMDLPHAPYLFFMGAGEYSVIKDSYKGKEVSYYVEKEYAPVARRIFGHTPEMMSYFSRIIGVEFPWSKYGQIVSRDYVSGAMENTTATIHQESAYQDARQLVDGNSWEDVIAHELFHQWFGDYVTTESWSNLALNESFANYSEYLWREYKYGKDAADDHHYSDMSGYIQSQSENKDLVRFYYRDKEDMFDAVSYNKGGRILHMLRNIVGDSAFFKALNVYLTSNKFKAGEAHNLRLAFEDITGKDLNWYFNQWFFGSGHPKLDVNYSYDEANKKAMVIVRQTQTTGKVFKLPVAIDIYEGGKKERKQIWVRNKVDTFSFTYNTKPDLVNFDGDKYLLTDKRESGKTIDNFSFQYKNAGLYLDRREAIDFAARNQDDAKAIELLKASLTDKYDGLRTYALGKIDMRKPNVRTAMESVIYQLALKDPKATVRAKAISLLPNYDKAEYKALYIKSLSDSSYSVAGEALDALAAVDSAAGYKEAQRLAKLPAKGKLGDAISEALIKFGDETAFDVIAKNFDDLPLSQAKFDKLPVFANFLEKVKDTEKLKKGVDMIIEFRNAIPAAFRPQTDPFINNIVLKGLANKKQNAGLKDQADYINSKIGDQKGF